MMCRCMCATTRGVLVWATRRLLFSYGCCVLTVCLHLALPCCQQPLCRAYVFLNLPYGCCPVAVLWYQRRGLWLLAAAARAVLP